jgi:hypothetical protein
MSQGQAVSRLTNLMLPIFYTANPTKSIDFREFPAISCIFPAKDGAPDSALKALLGQIKSTCCVFFSPTSRGYGEDTILLVRVLYKCHYGLAKL